MFSENEWDKCIARPRSDNQLMRASRAVGLAGLIALCAARAVQPPCVRNGQHAQRRRALKWDAARAQSCHHEAKYPRQSDSISYYHCDRKTLRTPADQEQQARRSHA